MHKLYEFPPSGNCYKIRLLFSNLGLPLKSQVVDITKGESRSKEYLERNPVGQVPLLEFADGRLLPESPAILWHMARGTPLLPDDPWLQTQVLRWLSFEQYKLEPNIGVARFLLKTMKKAPEKAGPVLDELQNGGRFALTILDNALAGKDFLVGDVYSIADIGLYGYTHLAGDADISLSPYPDIHRWFKNVENQPGYIPLEYRGEDNA